MQNTLKQQAEPFVMPSVSTADELLSSRRSIRRYAQLPVSRELIESLLRTAVTAPSAHNRQPWRFLVLECNEDKDKLAKAMGALLRADRNRDGDDAQAIEADVARSYARLTGAPVLIVVCMSMIDMDRYPDTKRMQAERIMAIQGTAMAAQNLLLAAHASGLGACWMCAPLFCADTVHATLQLPDDWEPQAIITLGYPAHSGKPFSRRALHEVVQFREGAP
ncbi:MAG: nitroreductase family protein [Betaproteobacteria bacterium]|nr:MAG: nitroreductase family protein [Betaproteobacteria bacterium]